MKEIQGKLTLVRVGEGSSYRDLISGPKSYRDFRETGPRAFPALENRSGEWGGEFSNEKALGTRLVLGSYYLYQAPADSYSLI